MCVQPAELPLVLVRNKCSCPQALAASWTKSPNAWVMERKALSKASYSVSAQTGLKRCLEESAGCYLPEKCAAIQEMGRLSLTNALCSAALHEVSEGDCY